MDLHLYRSLRSSGASDLHQGVNDPEHPFYEVLWELFEELVVEPAEVFDSEFSESNQFRFAGIQELVMEFLPGPEYYRSTGRPNPVELASDRGGLHLQLHVAPSRSCLFSVGFVLSDHREVEAFRRLWEPHRRLIRLLLHKARPTITHRLPAALVNHARTVEELLDNCLGYAERSPFLALQYPFARADDSEAPADFMVFMAMFYLSVRSLVEDGEDIVLDCFHRLKSFYGSRLPSLPPPLPFVELTISKDAE